MKITQQLMGFESFRKQVFDEEGGGGGELLEIFTKRFFFRRQQFWCCYCGWCCVTPKATASFIKRHAIMWINKFLMKSLRSKFTQACVEHLEFLFCTSVIFQINTLTWKSSRDVALQSTASHFVINCLKEDIKKMKKKNRQNCHACCHKQYLK